MTSCDRVSCGTRVLASTSTLHALRSARTVPLPLAVRYCTREQLRRHPAWIIFMRSCVCPLEIVCILLWNGTLAALPPLLTPLQRERSNLLCGITCASVGGSPDGRRAERPMLTRRSLPPLLPAHRVHNLRCVALDNILFSCNTLVRSLLYPIGGFCSGARVI